MTNPFTPIDATRPHAARVYDYLLGGKDNFAVDRAAADALLAEVRSAEAAARANRRFMQRAVGLLAGQGVRQFLDLGTGLPTSPNVHEVAQRYQSDARVVYVDNDPLVLAHARALLTSHPDGVTAYVGADVTDVAAVLDDPDLATTLDFGRPVAVLAIAVAHFLPGDTAHRTMDRYREALSPGSYVAVSHFTTDLLDDAAARRAREAAARMRTGVVPRTRAQFADFFAGTRLLDPGIVPVHRWRPDEAETHAQAGAGLTDAQVNMWGAVGRCD
ncbi:O-methyltransferase involved in polyketide biosynthesis [Catenuloplanes nepalensis]|uniref:O-methyltransferase involved in polyketide biosynthesis n=1 Tax=Catenuloplanes nepalensis TaxID=587533 RepID=A0ABT9MMA4_9ACTN|nr:SAM-dependent methyltransferase [Catenuloplanes nepalensis]MDP9792535.1 O-methyltransferase involved in polyketide biosynthesis [Catenuloplanes nepalensis]